VSRRPIGVVNRDERPRARFSLPRNPFGYALVATLGVGCGIGVLAALSSLGSVFLYVGVALFITLALDPAVQALTRRRVPRTGAVVILSLGSLGLLAFAGAVVIPALSAQVAALAVKLFTWIERIPEQEWFHWLSSVAIDLIDLDKLTGDAAAFLGDPDKLLALGGGVLRVGSGIIDGITGVLIVTALTVYFVATLPRLKAKTYQLVPRDSRDGVRALAEEILQSVGRYVGGQLVLAALGALVTFVLTSSLGSPAPFVLAALAFVGSLIPVFGPVVSSSITVLLTFVENPAAALVAAVVLLIYMQVEAYVLTPRVMSHAVKVPGALVIVAALAGVALGGILGAFVAVPIAAAGVTIVERVVIPRQNLPSAARRQW
jgi:predicted PurR-regulated permease PerM